MSADAGARAWALLQDFVEAQQRRAELADALGFRLGGGRGRALQALRQGPVTMRELAGVLGTDPPYATLVADKLEAQGLVERRPHPEDRRRKLVSLTPAGESAVATIDHVWRRPPAAMAHLTPRETADLTRILGRLLADDGESGEEGGR